MVAQPSRRDPDVDSMWFQPCVLRHQGEGADLAAVADFDVDVDNAAKPDGDVRSDAHTSGFDDAAFNSVTGNVHVGADDDVVADIQQIVIGNRQCVDEHTFTNAGAVHPQVGGPYW